MSDTYQEYLGRKFATYDFDGITGAKLSDALFPHQHDLVMWALRRGRAAIFADTDFVKDAFPDCVDRV